MHIGRVFVIFQLNQQFVFLCLQQMGVIRSSPDTQIHIKSQKFSDVNYLEASVCGWQHNMEDYTGYAKINDRVSIFYVIDGHGGPDAAEITAQLIPKILKNNQYKLAIQQLYKTLDESLLKQTDRCSEIRKKFNLPPLIDKQPTSGCSLVLALIGQQEIVISNIGQCKAFVCYSSNPSKAVMISGNHNENNKQDENRIKNAGGFFINGRVNGLFSFTRSIGDYALKKNQFFSKQQQILVSTPSIFALRKQDIKIIVMGSAGLWEKTNFVLKQLTSDDLELQELQQKAKQTIQQIISKNPKQGQIGLNNISVVVIDVKK